MSNHSKKLIELAKLIQGRATNDRDVDYCLPEISDDLSNNVFLNEALSP